MTKGVRPETYEYYLLDLGDYLKEYALDAKRACDKHRGTEDYGFYSGIRLAYYGVITLMQQQARGFGIPLEDLKLHDIDPDKDLV